MSKKNKSMTRKEALAVLHKVHNAVGWHLCDPDASEECKVLAKSVHTAFRVLDEALHGDPIKYSSDLCVVCYLRPGLRDQYVYLKSKAHISQPCCAPCLEQLQQEQQIIALEYWEWDPETYKPNIRKEMVQV